MRILYVIILLNYDHYQKIFDNHSFSRAVD